MLCVDASIFNICLCSVYASHTFFSLMIYAIYAKGKAVSITEVQHCGI